MRDEIVTGIRNGQFHVVYQPFFTADGSRLMGVEALVRWNHPVRGPVGPSDFIAVAEEVSAISELGEIVLRQACHDAKGWEGVSLAVNVSTHQLGKPGFVDSVIAIAEAEGFPLGRLELEIVESALIENFELASQIIGALRKLGVKIALDDFGTGYSSLTYLRKLPFDKLKIDKSFVDNVDEVQSAAIVQAVIAMARALGLKVTAEGVETVAQHKFLRVSGCHYVQGYLFSKPVSALAISQMLVSSSATRLAV